MSVVDLLLPLLPLHAELPPEPAGSLLVAGCDFVAAGAAQGAGGEFTLLTPARMAAFQLAAAQVSILPGSTKCSFPFRQSNGAVTSWKLLYNCIAPRHLEIVGTAAYHRDILLACW